MTANNSFTFARQPNLNFGQRFEPQYRFKSDEKTRSWNSDKDVARRQFQPPPGVYRARELIAEFSPYPGHTLFHRVDDALALPGLVFSALASEQHDDTLHVFPISDPLLGLALFGKLYPGNVVSLSGAGDFASTLQAGRGFGTKFVHWQRT